MSSLVTVSDPRSAAAEAYRSLRTNLAFARPGEPLRTLLVSAPSPDEERSVTAANLAVVTAQSGLRVIVADCDLRRPAQHLLFGIDNDDGLTNLLVSDGDAVALPLQSTSVEGLQVLASGPLPPNPAELLGSRRMREAVARLSSEADLVIFDAPPLLPVTDAAVLAPLLDGVVVVLGSGRSRRDQAARAREILDNVGAQVLGVVLTNVEPSRSTYASYGPEGA